MSEFDLDKEWQELAKKFGQTATSRNNDSDDESDSDEESQEESPSASGLKNATAGVWYRNCCLCQSQWYLQAPYLL